VLRTIFGLFSFQKLYEIQFLKVLGILKGVLQNILKPPEATRGILRGDTMTAKRIISALAACLLLAGLLGGCGKPASGGGLAAPPTVATTAPVTATTAATTEAATTAPAPAAKVELFSDADGLATARLMDGAVQVRLNPEAWAKVYGFKDIQLNFKNPDTFITVEGVEGDIADIIIAPVPGFAGMHYEDVDYETPMLAMLMKDGTVHWAHLDPYNTGFESWGALPFLEGVVSLEAGVQTDGIGERTLFAFDAKGRRCDIAVLFPHSITDVRNYNWVTPLETHDETPLYGYLSLNGDGSAVYEIAQRYSADMAARYTGRYHMVVWEGEQHRPGMLELNLGQLKVYDTEFELPPSLNTTFFADPGVQDLFLTLHMAEGDGLLGMNEVYWCQADDLSAAGLIGTWSAPSVYTPDGNEFALGLEFYRDGSMRYWYGWPYSDIIEDFEGFCWMVYGYQPDDPGMLGVTFSMTLAGGLALEDSEPYSFYGEYGIAVGEEDTVTVHHIYGDPLFYGMHEDEAITFMRSVG